MASTTPIVADRSLRSYGRQFLADFVHLEGRGWLSLRAVILRPGELEQATLEGTESRSAREIRGGLVHPVRIYLVVNLLFFLLVPFFNTKYGTIWSMDANSLSMLHPSYGQVQARQAEELAVERGAYVRLFDLQSRSIQGAFVVVMLPIFGLILWLCFHRRRRYLVEHLLLSTSAYTVFLISLMALGVIARLVVALGAGSSAAGAAMGVVALCWLVAQTAWLYGAMRRYYRLSRRWAALFAVPLLLAFMTPFLAYMHVLFWATWWALRTV